MNLRNVGTDTWLIGVDSTIPDFWTIFFEQHGDVSININMTHSVSRNSTVPMNTSIRFHPRIAFYVENFFLHP
jgi:hypothetical protein